MLCGTINCHSLERRLRNYASHRNETTNGGIKWRYQQYRYSGGMVTTNVYTYCSPFIKLNSINSDDDKTCSFCHQFWAWALFSVLFCSVLCVGICRVWVVCARSSSFLGSRFIWQREWARDSLAICIWFYMKVDCLVGSLVVFLLPLYSFCFCWCCHYCRHRRHHRRHLIVLFLLLLLLLLYHLVHCRWFHISGAARAPEKQSTFKFIKIV